MIRTIIASVVVLLSCMLSNCGPDRPSTLAKDSTPNAEFSLTNSDYQVGVGIADITGPATGVQMLGYVKAGQETAGIHIRLRSRAFIIANADASDRIVLVESDMLGQFVDVTQEVIRRLQEKYDNTYRFENVVLTANHTHSGPGNYSTYRLYNLLYQFGFDKHNWETIVSGIVRAISKAHDNLQPAQLSLGQSMLLGVNRNRAAEAYALNADADHYRFDQDKQVTQINIESASGQPMGIMNWFPVHTTSMKSENRLISGDNKGLAAYRFEQEMGTIYRDNQQFVAGFFNSNAGDSSPNIAGDLTGDDEWNCAAIDSFTCTSESAEAQLEKARQIFHAPALPLSGPIDYRHRWIDFGSLKVEAAYTGQGEQTTCPAAIGLSKLAGTKDGRGVGKEGSTCEAVGPIAEGIMCREKVECHGTKPVVIASGYVDTEWTPQILPIQLVRIGQVAIVAGPAEFTTMSGRRIRNAVRNILGEAGVEHVIFAGYANAYAGYVTTREEYQIQLYEAASNHFGEWTEAGYRQEYAKLARAMIDGFKVPAGQPPVSLVETVRRTPAPGIDRAGMGNKFGDLVKDTRKRYSIGERVTATFVGSSLAHDTFSEKSFFDVEKKVDGEWQVVASDWDESTRLYHLDRRLRRSHLRGEWYIPADTVDGRYRLVMRGKAKVSSGLVDYEGVSSEFEVLASPK